MKFNELRKINVNDHIEKKNGLSYLSWAWAVDTLLQNDPAATWSYDEPKTFGKTLMVFCTVTAFGKSMTAQLPVLNYSNKAIENPDAMSVNTAMQRCLAKAIALHGIGLYIYAGEDIPVDEPVKKPEAVTPNAGALDGYSKDEIDLLHKMAEEFAHFVSVNDMNVAKDLWASLDNEQKTALWSLLDSKTRSTFKKG
jgi:hypothetical protein